MPRDTLQRARLIRIDVSEGEARLLVATSPDLPEFEVVGLTREELADEVPACLELLFKAKHGRDVRVLLLEAEAFAHPFAYSAWAGGPGCERHPEQMA